ncbi:peptide mating pheromone precursor Bbp2-2 [Schizophyllum commune H4-8]|uniref:Peptide mating pheromone bbp2-2 n=2 Tax=Schizophyllum commune TaxID=5334 RepID=D8QF29_SCHCM|nr:peptide mating pheromone precursor Bbp2-2 [Schizophyllum commune H4-8]AAK58074.1 peptide mating pheromone precursor Bbp2-2 [Schizophyllum commune]KAI5887459.1 peptide mating pheromone precursor Bbp2-2 [Schizophyllum commune H4-8]
MDAQTTAPPTRPASPSPFAPSTAPTTVTPPASAAPPTNDTILALLANLEHEEDTDSNVHGWCIIA